MYRDIAIAELTDRGLSYLNNKLPEERLVEKLQQYGEKCVNINELAYGMDFKEFSAAIGRLQRYNIVVIRNSMACFRGLSEEFKRYVQKLHECLEKIREPKPYEMVLLDIDDIRLLYTNDVEYIRGVKLPLGVLLHAYSNG